MRRPMLVVHPASLDFADAWIDGDGTAQWRSAPATTPAGGTQASGSNVLEVPPGCRLPRHTDSAEETIVVLDGRARVRVGDHEDEVPAGGLALVPANVPHEVRNAGNDALRFVALYASPEVVTRYETAVEPDGSSERRPLG
jgi:quercetin dioxygenase-like cupin family protein